MAPIGRYYILDFGTPKRALEAAGSLIDFLGSPAGLKYGTGPRRAVIWGEGLKAPPETQGRLYISDGAADAVRERKLDFPPGEAIPADQLPVTAQLVHGNPK
jgi:hypothetical protein